MWLATLALSLFLKEQKQRPSGTSSSQFNSALGIFVITVIMVGSQYVSLGSAIIIIIIILIFLLL